MRAAGNSHHGLRFRGLIVVLARWAAHPRGSRPQRVRSGRRRDSLLVRRGKGGRRREPASTRAWEQLAPWTDVRLELPVGPLFSIINGSTRGRPWSAAVARAHLRQTPRPPAAVGASRRISFATPTRSRWPTRACL